MTDMVLLRDERIEIFSSKNSERIGKSEN